MSSTILKARQQKPKKYITLQERIKKSPRSHTIKERPICVAKMMLSIKPKTN
jgi:hypothetical protein